MARRTGWIRWVVVAALPVVFVFIVVGAYWYGEMQEQGKGLPYAVGAATILGGFGGAVGWSVNHARRRSAGSDVGLPPLASATDEKIRFGDADPVTSLGVHQAVLAADQSDHDPFIPHVTHGLDALTPYMPRGHDKRIQEAIRPAATGNASVLVMVTGDSSTGKTRALYEALRYLAPDRVVLRPSDAASLLEQLRAGRVNDQTVLWLNEAQRFFDRSHSEEAAVCLRELLVKQIGIIAVGTLWPQPWEKLTRPGSEGDPHSHVRDVLTLPQVTVHVRVPDHLSEDEQKKWRALAEKQGDQRMIDALNAAKSDGRIVQHLSGGPELLQAFLDGPNQHFTYVEHALLTAAIDARRLGHRTPLSAKLLADAADGTIISKKRLAERDWARKALTALSTGERDNQQRTDIRCTLTALTTVRTASGAEALYEPADYLDQRLRTIRADQLGSASLWQALLDHTTDPDDLSSLADAAKHRGLLQHAARLYHRAILAQHPHAACELVGLLSSDTDPHQHGSCWAAAHTSLTDPVSVTWLLMSLHEKGQKDATDLLLARDFAVDVNLSDLWAVSRQLLILDAARQSQAVAELAARAANDAPLTDAGDVARLLKALHEVEQNDAVAELAARAANDAPLTDPWNVVLLLKALHEVEQNDAIAQVLARNPAAEVAVTDAGDVARLLKALHEVEQNDAVAELAARAANDAPLTDPWNVVLLLEALC
ncbi:hypothetical protein ONR57_22665 [Hoyosella sp. YIM 151337]|uniref:hypothetical protein n=1 Tax=Hoyosella sp. YIM 151337 TaxID=2992742 RepID=UPI002235E39A|nr:hypothetical protein [Hoyosella sp. YIM 151337]MCW4356112.1 hypothetical protein [Hoyosella sp. YIM 151337]